MGCDTTFLDQNLMGNPKKELKIQNFKPFPRSGNTQYIAYILHTFYTYTGNSVKIDQNYLWDTDM